MKTNPASEKGQIIVIFAIALTALLAFTALAIDGGMIYADRRQSQSVADTASLAGAGAAAQYLDDNGVTYTSFSCSNPKVIASMNVAYTAALNRATINQVPNLDNDLSDNHGIEVLCVNDDANFEKHLDVHTKVTSSVMTSFVQIVFPGPIKNTVNAVARIHVRTEMAYGRAIESISDACGTNTGGIVFDGTSDVHITGGGVFSNSCIDAGGNVVVDVNDGGISYIGDLTRNGHPYLSPDPDQASTKMPNQDINVPSCGSGPAINWSGSGTISPGNYSKIKLTNGSLTLNPGLYCLTGDISLQGGEFIGDGVTFYMMKDGGNDTSFLVNGNVTTHLNAPLNNPVNGAEAGILIYMAEGNNGNISLEGTSGSSFSGLVYAPDAKIDIGGTSDAATPGDPPPGMVYSTQLIGKYIKVHGTSRIDINYVSSPVVTTEPSLDLLE